MKNEFTAELVEKAKGAKSVAELIDIAKENGVELTIQQVANYFAKLHPQSSDIADMELENVAGGGCYNGDGRLIVTASYKCNNWSCVHCGQPDSAHEYYELKRPFMHGTGRHCQNGTVTTTACSDCGYCIASGAYIVCTHPANHN